MALDTRENYKVRVPKLLLFSYFSGFLGTRAGYMARRRNMCDESNDAVPFGGFAD
jgi:hypothetical protein